MMIEILKWLFLALAVWIIVSTLVALVIGKSIHGADKELHGRAQSPRVRARGRHLVVMRRVD